MVYPQNGCFYHLLTWERLRVRSTLLTKESADFRRLKTKKLFESVFCTGLLALFEFYKSAQSA